MKKIKNLEIMDENKIKILYQLFMCREDLCGCDLTEELDIPKNLLSYHVSILKDKDFVKDERCGKHKKYSLVETKIPLVRHILMSVELI